MKLSRTLAILFSSSLLALSACGTSTIGGGSGGGGGTGAGDNQGGSGAGFCNGEEHTVPCTADSECPAGYRCVEDQDPNACFSSGCECDPQYGWVCNADCQVGAHICVKPDPGVQCTGTNGGSFPSFDKDCTADSDCVTKLHQINCCGTRVAIGVNVSNAAAFDAAEATCESQFPGCGCAEQATTAEDGHARANYGDDIPVACKAGQCTTFIPEAQLCNGMPSPVSCGSKSCPDGWTCTPDPDPSTCHSSGCSCTADGWVCDADCTQNGSTCVKGL